MSASRRRSPSRDHLRLAALVVLCFGVLDQFGDFSDLAVVCVTASAGLMALSLSAPRGTASPRAYAIAAGALALMQLRYRTQYSSELIVPIIVLAIAAPIACLAASRRVALSAVACAGAAAAAIVAIPWRWGRSPIDAFLFVQTSADELARGHNPYGPLMPTFIAYDKPPVLSHFDYGPAVAILAVPGRIAGDVRLMSVVLFVALFAATAVLAAHSHDTGRTARIAALCAAFPLTAGMVISSWVDIYTLAGFAGWVVLRERRRGLAVAALALAVATKPTIAPLLLPFLAWSPPARREVALACLGSLALMLPFIAATGPTQFIHDVIGVDFDYPTRVDALTFNAFAHWHLGGAVLPAWLGVSAVAVVAAAALRVRPRDHADLLGAAALITTVAFLVAKWAYLNYYFLAAFLLVMASAGEGVTLPERAVVRLPRLALGRPGLRRAAVRPIPTPSSPPA